MNDKRDYTKVPGERDPRPAVVPKPTCLRIEPMQCVDFKPDDEENQGQTTLMDKIDEGDYEEQIKIELSKTFENIE